MSAHDKLLEAIQEVVREKSDSQTRVVTDFVIGYASVEMGDRDAGFTGMITNGPGHAIIGLVEVLRRDVERRL